MVTRTHIRFLLGGEPRRIDHFDPTLTLLDYLRQTEGRVGTKEGCAEGDCGACTVVIARPDGQGGLTHRAVNACIAFAGTLDGAQVLTVEDLAGADGALHPVQQALVDAHGAQCGFCTPGFVMSLFAQSTLAPEQRPPVDDALAGNLCRCTGYAPIVRAAEAALAGALRDEGDAGEIALRLDSLDDGADLAVGGFLAPASLDSLADLLLARPTATLLAGGTDVGLWVTKQLKRLDPVIYLGRIPELGWVEDLGDELRIGASAPYAQVLPVLAAEIPDFAALLRRIGGTQVRNLGTVGGNIANGSPIGDTPPALIALGATLHLRRGTETRDLPVERFFIAYGQQDRAPGEFITGVTVPKPGPEQCFKAYKVSKRFDQDITAVLGAFSLRYESGMARGVRLAFGGLAGTPKRARQAEAVLENKPFDEAAITAAMAALEQDFTPLSDMRASSTYRLMVARHLLYRFYLDVTAGDQPRLETAEAVTHV